MNATINSATGVSPHNTITGCHPNTGLPKLHKKKIANDDLGAYGMQINALLRQVHHCITLANNKADHKTETRLNHLPYKDPTKVGDKVLIYRPQSTIAQSSYPPWIGEFTVVKTNDMMSQMENENSDKNWIHHAHIHCFAPLPTHLSDITLSLSPCDTLQNTQDHSSLCILEHVTQTSRPSNITPQQTQNERKQMQ